MKLFMFLVFVFGFIGMIWGIVWSFTDQSTKPMKKNVRNFKVRFDAAAEKYYIVNELPTYDEPVTNWFGIRVKYKDKLKAEFVKDKLNS